MSVNRKDGSSSTEECVAEAYAGKEGGRTGSLSSPLASQLHTFTQIESRQICAVTFVWGITLTAALSLLCNSEPQPWAPNTTPPLTTFHTSMILTVDEL